MNTPDPIEEHLRRFRLAQPPDGLHDRLSEIATAAASDAAMGAGESPPPFWSWRGWGVEAVLATVLLAALTMTPRLPADVEGGRGTESATTATAVVAAAEAPRMEIRQPSDGGEWTRLLGADASTTALLRDRIERGQKLVELEWARGPFSGGR